MPERSKAPQTIEQTGKNWKLLYGIGAVVMAFGAFGCFVGVMDPSGKTPTTSLIFFTVGVALWFIGRLGAWWHHG